MPIVDTSGTTAIRHMLMKVGKVESTISMSLAKRFTMRPMGVVSKKEIGARRMASTSAEYSLVEAETEAQARAIDCTETKNTGTTMDTLQGVVVAMTLQF